MSLPTEIEIHHVTSSLNNPIHLESVLLVPIRKLRAYIHISLARLRLEHYFYSFHDRDFDRGPSQRNFRTSRAYIANVYYGHLAKTRISSSAFHDNQPC